ncbi:MAG: DUF3093 domain-containing protein [Microbacterium sp.]|uniref:DUF3093 domain-containing protein n=1 Tax=Microbacterium sp. TaxID=51671 RepID=UPI0039E359D6
MQNFAQASGHSGQSLSGKLYRERLTPSLWTFAAAALVAPMASLVFVRMDAVVALVVGIGVAVAVIGLMAWLSPVVEVKDGWLFAGRARIDARFLGEPAPHSGEAARLQRGPGLNARSWHLIRGGIDGLVVIPITDPADATPFWVISTRTPDRLSAALRWAGAGDGKA